MFCGYCGSRIEEADDKFCSSCGKPVEPMSQTPDISPILSESPGVATAEAVCEAAPVVAVAPEPKIPAPAPTVSKPPGRRQKSYAVPLIIVSCLAVVCVAGLLWYFLGPLGSDDSSQNYLASGSGREASPEATPGVDITLDPVAEEAAPDDGNDADEHDSETQGLETMEPELGIDLVVPLDEAPEVDLDEAQDFYPEEAAAKTIDEVILGTSDWVKLSINWPNGQQTVFERNKGIDIWIMLSRDGSCRMVDPDFSSTRDAFTIGFPTTSTRYRLLEDNSGFFNGPFTWTFETDQEFSKTSVAETKQTYLLNEILSGSMLIRINVHWSNGDTVILYRQDNGSWMMKGRNGSFASVKPSFSSSSGEVSASFPASSTQYVFHEDGSGAYGSESFNWTYDYSER